MKFLTALFTLIVGVSIARAATPSYQSFDSNQFSYTSGHIWIKNGAKLTNLVILGNVTLNGNAITNWPTGGTGGTNFDILDVGTIFVTNGITLGGTTATNWVWINDNGTITPAPGQTTNTLEFTSGLAESTNSSAAVIDSSTPWGVGSLLSLRNNSTNKLTVAPSAGGLRMSSANDTNFQINFWSAIPGDQGETLISFNDTTEGKPDMFDIFAGSGDPNGLYGYAEVFGSSTDSRLKLAASGMLRTGLIPGISDGQTPYHLDTTLTHTSGFLMEVQNNNTNKFTVDYAGNVSAAGTASVGELQSGSFAVFQTALGNGSTFALDMGLTNRVYSCFPTGHVTFSFSNLSAGKMIDLYLVNTNATNINVTFPAEAHFHGYRPTVIYAGRGGEWFGKDWTVSSTNRVVSTYSEEQ